MNAHAFNKPTFNPKQPSTFNLQPNNLQPSTFNLQPNNLQPNNLQPNNLQINNPIRTVSKTMMRRLVDLC
ncbi:MAG: hypothetical protein F6J98_26135 [Moorea sp. SIO4G2]|nr:hypothetical protein [Moorena sp. SIO4G2]